MKRITKLYLCLLVESSVTAFCLSYLLSIYVTTGIVLPIGVVGLIIWICLTLVCAYDLLKERMK